MEHICTKCGEKKLADQFYERKGTVKKVTSWCRACFSALMVHKQYAKYGLTDAEYDAMFMKQGGLCAICGCSETKRRLAVDHNHNTGEIRALLCGKCNGGIGILRDNSQLCRAAADYLDSF